MGSGRARALGGRGADPPVPVVSGPRAEFDSEIPRCVGLAMAMAGAAVRGSALFGSQAHGANGPAGVLHVVRWILLRPTSYVGRIDVKVGV